MRALLLLVLTSCTVVDTVEGRFTSGGTVFICEGKNSSGATNEWCYDGPASDIEQDVGLDCHSTGLFERTSIVGCWYHCDDPETAKDEGDGGGCNAHNGCYCP